MRRVLTTLSHASVEDWFCGLILAAFVVAFIKV